MTRSDAPGSGVERFRAPDGVHKVVEEREDEYITVLEGDGQKFAWPKNLGERDDVEVLD